MLSVAIIVFREILEIALVFSVLLISTRGLAGNSKMSWLGALLGTAGACLIAYFAAAISAVAEGMGQELFNATVLLLAATLITWHIVWMSQHGKEMAKHFKQVGHLVIRGERPLYMLAIIMAVAVLREGSEIVLFTYGMIIQGIALSEVFIGGMLGLMAGALAGALLYYGLLQISPKKLFSVTSGLLIFLTAGMVAQAVGFLSAAGWVPEIVSPVWDTSNFLSEKSLLGKILHSLVGYSDRPTGAQLIAYLITLGGIIMILKKYGDTSSKSKKSGFSKKAVVAVLIAIFIGVSNFSKEAWATKKVYSPHVQKGELEIEARGNYDFDTSDEKDGAQKQKYAIGYGINNFWFTEVYGEMEKEAEESWEFEAVEWENRFQISEPGEWFIDTGLYFAYEFAAEDEKADKVEGKLLLEKQLGEFDHILNLILEEDAGPHAEADVEGGLAWSSRYRLKPYFEPGFEWHSDFGELGKGTSFDEQKHQLGPVVYGKINDHIKYDVGYLFGVSDAAPDGMLKWIIEFEWYF